MTKKKKKELSEEEKAAKKAKAAERNKKYDSPEDTSVVLNETKVGKTTITTFAQPIRGKGVIVTQVSSMGGVSTCFVPEVKIKSKKAWKFLVEDKPKKKEK